MGAIIYWAIIRVAILIPSLWIFFEYIEYKYWISISFLSIYGVIIHPAAIQYRLFREKHENIITNTLCSTCKHFNESAVICLKYDEHPTEDKLPCEGSEWEPTLEK